MSVLLGAAVHITEFSTDGYALPTLANAWATAAPATSEPGVWRPVGARRDRRRRRARWPSYGHTLILFGLAARSERYDSALCWNGVIFGAGIFAFGAIQLVKPHVVFPGILYGGGALVSQL